MSEYALFLLNLHPWTTMVLPAIPSLPMLMSCKPPLEPIKYMWAVACDFQQCGILTSVDSDEHVHPPFKLRTSKRFLVSSLALIEYSSDEQRLWSDCVYGQAGLRLRWSHIPDCRKSHALAHVLEPHVKWGLGVNPRKLNLMPLVTHYWPFQVDALLWFLAVLCYYFIVQFKMHVLIQLLSNSESPPVWKRAAYWVHHMSFV